MNTYRKAVESWDHLWNRGVAMLLAAAMTLPMLPAVAWADSPIVTPTQITEDTKSKFPKIEFQTNFVRTEYGTLTGLMELAIRVGPSESDGDGKPIPVDFQSVAATLQFNTTLFKPISWQWAYGELGEATPIDIELETNVASYYDVQLPAKKDDTLPGTGAIAQCGVVKPAPAGMSTNVTNGDQALLFFKAEAYGQAITIAEMTTLAVVRFYVDPALMKHISILRNKVTGDYSVLFDGKREEADWITNQAKLDEEIAKVAGTGTTPPDPDPSPAPEAPGTRDNTTLTLPTGFVSVGFAVDADMAKSQSPADMSLHYSTGDNEFYYVPGYDPDNPVTESVDIDTGLLNGQSLLAPVTEGERVLAIEKDAPKNSTDPKHYSYFSNLMPKANISFPVVSQLSFADNGDGRENMATVLFYDWDDTLIGVLVVPRNDDARALVNEYVRDNMIHPALRFSLGGEPNTSTDTDLIKSLTRANSYRGKYPYSAPMADGAGLNEVEKDSDGNIVGEKYPLTNKLDYVFLKRPMVKDETAPDITATGEPTSTWIQPGTTGAVEWDDEYPYIHGWALIPDKDLTDIQYTHPEKIWTTIGMGELGDYNGALSGGYQDMNGAPGQLIATGQEFTIANFDFHEKVLEKGSVYAVKAIYEPGEDLLSLLYNYRMISKPYYNKLNDVSASSGGAYSADVTFERASAEVNDVIRGVARMREPYVRQDTTSDLRWEQLEGEGFVIDHNLPNASYTEAYSDRNKTTYTKVDVTNTEEVSFSLTLSARQNKVGYFLIEGYGYNFVSGGTRTANDTTRSGDDAVVDNYHYFVAGVVPDGSDLLDEWYDPSYEDREGSRGFVLYGTLNQLMEAATKYNKGSYTMADLYSKMSTEVFLDVNLRFANGRVPESFDDSEALILSLIDAAKAAEPSNNGGSTKYWDTVHDCALLTYHQLQGFIIDGSLNHDEHPVMSGGSVALTWCHLHKECVDAVSSKPKDWKGLIDAARNHPEDIDGLTLVEVEELFHLRANSSGTAFASVSDFREAMVKAVVGTTGTPGWAQIQANIVGETLPALAEQNYWWYDGQSVMFSSLSDTVNAVKDSITPVKLPDGSISLRYDKINQLRGAFEENTSSASVPRSWNNATKNLCITKGTSEGEKFDSFADFRIAFIAAVTAAEAAGDKLIYEDTDTAAIRAQKLREYWNKLQYHILNNTYSSEQLPEMNKYWWFDGNSKIADLVTLLATAKRANSGDTTIWDLFTLEDLEKITDLRFRANFHGDRYTDANFADFKAAVLEFVQLSGVTIATQSSSQLQKTNSWNQLQYWLIHRPDTTDLARNANEEKEYYWWRDNEDGVTYQLVANATDVGVVTLMEAAYRFIANGNPKAYDQLNAAAMEGFRMVSSYTAENSWNDLPKYGSTGDTMDTLKINLETLYTAIVTAGDDYKTVSWRQIQHFLLGKGYVSNSALKADDTLIPSDSRDDENGYWWREGNEKPSGGEIKSDLDYFLEEVDKYLNGDLSDLEFAGKKGTTDSILDQYLLNKGTNKLNLYGGSVSKTATKPLPDLTDTYKTRVRDNILNLAKQMKADPAVKTSKGILDWYVLQYYCIYATPNKYTVGNPIISHEEAVKYYLETLVVKTGKDWVPDAYRDGEASASALMAMFSMAQRPNTLVDTDPETGITTVTTTTNTELEDGTTLCVETITVRDPANNTVLTTTVTTLLDEEGNILSQTVTEPVATPAEPEKPVCTCGSEDGIHTEDCPLYVAPEEPACTCGSEDGIHAEDCPLYVAPEAPVESPQVTETLEPSESEVPTPFPQPAETEPPQEELPQPSVPGSEEPEVTPTPEVTPAPEVTPIPEATVAPEVTPTPEPTESPEPEYTIETMPEVVDPEPEESIEETYTPKSVGTDDVPVDLSEPEVTVVETDPPLNGTLELRKRSAAMDYKVLSTKIATRKLRIRAGGVRMKQQNLKRIISPPGQPRSVPLLLQTDTMERRRTV